MGADMKTVEKVKHTPGPWLITGDDKAFVYALYVPKHCNYKDGKPQAENRFQLHVSQNRNVPLEEVQANAALIASAPAMYEALKSALEEMQNLTDENEGKDWFGLNCPNCDGAVPLPHSLGCRIKSALKSAEGTL